MAHVVSLQNESTCDTCDTKTLFTGSPKSRQPLSSRLRRARRPGRSHSYVPLHSWSALDLPPLHVAMALRRLEEPLPQVPVRHRPFTVIEPTVLPPLLVPASSHTVDEVGGVGVDGHSMILIYGLERHARSSYHHPQVGSVLFAAAYLLRLSIPEDYGPVAPGTAGSCGRSVGVDVGFRPGR